MSAEYNARLIAELYSQTDPLAATHICDEMIELGDAVFPRQIYEAYKRFKNTSYSHYFVSDLTRFKTQDASEFIKKIAHTTEKESDMSLLVGYLVEIEYYDSEIVNKIADTLKSELLSNFTEDFEISDYLEYIESSGRGLSEFEEILKNCFEDEEKNISLRRLVLHKLLKIQPTKHFKFYFDNYKLLKGKKSEVIFAEEISKWKNGIVPDFHKKILNEGSERAREILSSKLDKKIAEQKTELKKESESIEVKYLTADVISDIANLRSKINKISIADKRFGFPLFQQNEEIYLQNVPANSKESLVGYCMVLRSAFQGFSQDISNLIYSEERLKELMPDIDNLEGTINKFNYLLLDKNIKVDLTLFGLRNINRIVSKLAHPSEESKPDFLKLLESEGLLEAYKNDNWPQIHRELLKKYKEVLEKISKSLSN